MIEIYQGSIKLIKEGLELEVEGEIKQIYSHNKNIYFSGILSDYQDGNPRKLLGKYQMSFSNDFSGEVYINKKKGNKISGKVLSHLTNNYTGDVDSVEVDFLNLYPLGFEVIKKERKTYLGKAQLKYQDWIIELYKIEDYKEVEDKLKKFSGFAVTHKGVIRKQGKRFEIIDFEDILSKLLDFMNFIHGRRVGISLVEGYLKEQKVYKRFDNKAITAWYNTNNWYPKSHEDYLDLFGSFIRLFKNDLWNERKNFIVGTYLDCYSKQTVEVKIIMIQTFLELISHLCLVTGGRKSNRQYKKSSSTKNIEELFEELEINLEEANNYLSKNIPKDNNNFNNSIEFIVEMRNQVIHPRKSSLYKIKNLKTAYYLGKWLIDMVMLKLLDYNGRYKNSLSDSKWTGDVENGGSNYWVPWNENHNTKKIQGFVNPN